MTPGRRRSRLFLVAAGLLASAGTLGAQTLPVPDLPVPEPPDSPDQDLTQHAAPAPEMSPRPLPWEFELGAGLGWHENIEFVPADPRSDVMLVPRAAVARVFRDPRGELRVAARGLWTGYRNEEDLRRFYGDFDLAGSYMASRRARWYGAASYGIGDSTSAPILREQGVVLPRVGTRTLSGGLGISVTGRRHALRIEGRFNGTDFDSPDLTDGRSTRATVELEREIGARSAIGIGYALEHVLANAAGDWYFTHFGSVRWSRAVSARTAALLEGGASFTADGARAGLEHDQSFYGGASFTGELRRSRFTLFARREVAPAFGTGGSRLDLRAGLRATIAMGRAWEIEIDGSHVWPQATSAAPPAGASYDVFARLGRRLGGWLEAAGESRYRRLDAAGGQPEITGFDASVFLTFRPPRQTGRMLR